MLKESEEHPIGTFQEPFYGIVERIVNSDPEDLNFAEKVIYGLVVPPSYVDEDGNTQLYSLGIIRLPGVGGIRKGVIEGAGEAATGNIKYLRQKAVKQAWEQEKELVERTGQGTRPWTEAEKQELLENGKVSDYQGHHINSVNSNRELAGNPDNINFLDRFDHLDAHNGNWRNATSGELNPRK